MKDRKDIDKKYTWNLDVIYSNTTEFDKDYDLVIDKINSLKKYENTMMDNSDNFYDSIRLSFEIERLIDKLYCYGNLSFDLDTSNNNKQELCEKISNLRSKYSENSYFIVPSILKNDYSVIEKYIKDTYSQYHPKTTFIAYGADVSRSELASDDKIVVDWFKEKQVKPKNYYLVVGRFVPENNYETMIREFMKSKTKKDFVIITNIEHNKFYDELKRKTGFDKDKRIKFVGTVYDQQLLKKIRELAYGYLHGHEVGGTNPSLLEALASTDLNLLLDVGFNREVAEDAALYWDKNSGALAGTIEYADSISERDLNDISCKAKNRILNEYSWDYICTKYENLFLKG